MKTRALLFATLLLASFASADNLKTTLDSISKKLGKAMVKKDVATFEKITRPRVTDDFKCIENGKEMNYDEMITNFKQTIAMLKTVKSANEKTLSIDQHGDRATVTSLHHMEGTMSMDGKKTHKVAMTGKTTDEWVKVGKQWKLMRMTWTKQEMMMDGKPFNPNAGG